MIKLSVTKIAITAAAAIALCTAHAQETEFRIGAVGTLSGPYGVIGESMKKAAELAAEMRGNRVLGVPIKFTWEDDETKPQTAVQKATRFISDKSHILFAPVASGSTLAMMKVVERAKTPLLVTISSSDDITGKEKNPYTFRTSNSNEMEARMMERFVVSSGFKKIFTVGADASVSRDAQKLLKTRLERLGVAVVGEEWPAIGTRDFSIMINKAMQSDAEAVALFVSGNDLITFLKQGDQVKLQDKKKLFGSTTMDESLARAVGPGSLGIYSTMRYHFSVSNAANKAFVAAYRAKYNDYPDQYAGEAFDGMSWFLDVIDATKSWDKEAWVTAFRQSPRPNSVEGTKKMRLCDNQAEQPGFFGKAVAGSAGAPAITMQVTNSFEASELFDACR
jgi:branched-chain amino acid transport system substrate-binding protein